MTQHPQPSAEALREIGDLCQRDAMPLTERIEKINRIVLAALAAPGEVAKCECGMMQLRAEGMARAYINEATPAPGGGGDAYPPVPKNTLDRLIMLHGENARDYRGEDAGTANFHRQTADALKELRKLRRAHPPGGAQSGGEGGASAAEVQR